MLRTVLPRTTVPPLVWILDVDVVFGPALVPAFLVMDKVPGQARYRVVPIDDSDIEFREKN